MPRSEDTIHVPPELPDILKQFTKAAIKSQPKDVLAWSAAYFRAVSNGEQPLPMTNDVCRGANESDLNAAMLRILNKQLGPKKLVQLSVIREKWKDLAMCEEDLNQLISIGHFKGNVEWLKFFALGCSALSANITEAMKLICQLLSTDPDSGATKVPFPLFRDLYVYLAVMDGSISNDHIEKVNKYMQRVSKSQDGYVLSNNLHSSDCPPLAG